MHLILQRSFPTQSNPKWMNEEKNTAREGSISVKRFDYSHTMLRESSLMLVLKRITPFLIIAAVLGAIIGGLWLENKANRTWSIKQRQSFKQDNFVIVHSETLGDLVNPFSWWSPPDRVLIASQADKAAKLKDGPLVASFVMVRTDDFKTTAQHRNVLFFYDLKTKKCKETPCDPFWIPMDGAETEYHEPDKLESKLIDWMLRNEQR